MPVTSEITIVFLGSEYYQEGNQERVKYRYSATAHITVGFMNALRQPSAPRVNQQTNSRGIVFMRRNGKKPYDTFYGGSANRAAIFWFTLPADVIPPSWVQLVLTSPPARKEVRSNSAETTL